jgi:hypothetical protein
MVKNEFSSIIPSIDPVSSHLLLQMIRARLLSMFGIFADVLGVAKMNPNAGAVQARLLAPARGGRTFHLRFVHQFAVNSGRSWRRCDAAPAQRAGERR